MKNLKTFIGKLLIAFIVIMFVMNFESSLTSTNANTDGIPWMTNSYLLSENFKLKKEYEKLALKLTKMESYAHEIRTYDNEMYGKILGIDFDTTDFHKYKNDSISFIMRSNDSVFSEVSDRAFYAAEMLSTELTKLKETALLFKNNKNAILYYPTISPIKTKDFICISSVFGYREHPIKNEILFHEGIDISATIGTPVYATAQGRVIEVRYSNYGYGNKIVIRHAYGYETLYAHLSTINVKKGQWVHKNQIIGAVGNTGLSTGSHLHYEIHKNDKPRDPLGYFYVNMGEQLLANQ